MNQIIHKEKIFLRNLPLLKSISNLYKNKISLENTIIICVQHIVSTTYTFFHELFKIGLKPENLIILGKCYSTYPDVYEQLKKEKVNISPLSIAFNSHEPYDLQFEKFLDIFLKQIKIKDLYNFEKIIILDDGGQLLEKINYLFPHDINIIGIEQTSAGYHKIKNLNLFFPIINLARSFVKLKYESPLIIQLALRKILNNTQKLILKNSKILIIGNGTLGNIIYSRIQEITDQVIIYDEDPNKTQLDKFEFKKNLGNFDLIIGCTGKTSISKDDHKFLKRPVILASISSSDREFDAVYLRKKQKIFHNCHKELNVEGIYLINCGFPINFDEDYFNIDPNDFQLTRALIYISIIQANNHKKNVSGFIKLEDSLQNFLIKNLN